MGKIAFIFPGQGSQFVGMGKDLYESCDAARKVFDRFDEILGKNISKLCFEGPEEELKKTQNTQPAILATSIAALEVLRSKSDIKPDFVAGHSLGEYGALYTANVISLDDAIRLIGKRGELMASAKSGSMSAILGLDESKIKELLKEASSSGTVTVANYNTPDQTVITGEENAVLKANELCSAAGAKRVVPLAVSGAFHSPLMKEASESYSEFVSNVQINDAEIPVVTNVDAKLTTDRNEFKTKMVEQIYSSVYWTQTIQYLVDQGVDTFIEIGPGKVLAGMNKKIAKEAKTFNICDSQSIENVISAFISQ